MPSDTFTICTQCQHFHNKERGSDIWYNHECRAVERPKAQDPFDGKLRYYATNDLGRMSFGADRYANCRDINTDGNCPHFTEVIVRGAIRKILGM